MRQFQLGDLVLHNAETKERARIVAINTKYVPGESSNSLLIQFEDRSFGWSGRVSSITAYYDLIKPNLEFAGLWHTSADMLTYVPETLASYVHNYLVNKIPVNTDSFKKAVRDEQV